MTEENMNINQTREESCTDKKLPKVFVDGYTLVKISLVNNFVNCSKYISRSGLTFQGCMSYENGKLKDVQGIYYVLNAPVYSFWTRSKMTRNIDKLREIINEMIQNRIARNLELEKTKLLISYDNYSVTIYDKYIKGKILKFPLKAEQGHLKIVRVPKIDIKLTYEKIIQLQIYNHIVDFEKEVMKFNDIITFGGQGVLIYNDNDTSILVTLNSQDHEEVKVRIEPHELYLFSHPRPRRTHLD